jgi:uncharacterized protein (DUF1684 family)
MGHPRKRLVQRNTMTTDEEAYAAELAAWRADADAALRAPESWLSVAGLFWLREGESTMGADPACDVALPAGAAPAFVARLALRDGAVFVLEAAPELLVNGGPAPARPLRGPASGDPDRITVGRLVLQVHQSGDRRGIRVRDPEHPDRAAFAGRRWFPPRPELRLAGRFVPYDPPLAMAGPNLAGDVEERSCPGYVAFALGGEELRLDAFPAGRRLQIVFRDATSGVETYGAARFLYVEPGPDGAVDVDFNKAECPPCAFTPFATCPLPPARNRLAVAIRAGELAPEGH